MKRTLFLFALLSLLSFASARVEFELTPFSATTFRDAADLTATCAVAGAESFWCPQQDAELSLITTKGADYFFNPAGELVALFSKPQTGRDLGGNYSLDAGQNLIPLSASVPGGAVLINGNYPPPQNVQGSWQRVDADTFEGTFSYTAGDYNVDKRIIVSHVAQTFEVSLTVTPVGEAGAGAGEAASGATSEATVEPTVVQLAFPGIANQETPVVKVGHGESFTLDPGAQPIAAPRYISLQNNNRNTGVALVVRPIAQTDALEALRLSTRVIALEKTLPAIPATTATTAGTAGTAGTPATPEVSFDVEVYGGPNELVRFYQEGYQQLPGLFKPNILGRVSLGVLAVLAAIHDVVGSWGLSIIVLTLIFRVLVWPLIATQTRSMKGMQELQPKIQALQKKYKNDREKLTQETMKLYQEAGVNPAGGCLPIVLQMPLFIILWRVFSNFNFAEGFLWIPDLGLADPYYILPILYVGVMIGQSYFMTRGNPQSLRQQLLINVVFIFFVINFPAGVTLYWVVSMSVQVFQYYLINRQAPTPAKAA